MKSKNLIIILSHCDNIEKIDILKTNIKILKSNNFDVLLSSHIPVSKEIQSQIEYLIYDKSNPILHWPSRGMTYWKTLTTDQEKLKLVNILPDYGWTAFNQILATSNLGLSLDYTHYSFINYDTIITPLMLEQMKSPQDFVCSKVFESKNADGFRFPSFMFNIISKNNLKKLIPLISKEQYVAGSNQIPPYNFKDAEHYLGHLISVFNYEIFPEVIKDQIEYGDKNPFNFNKSDDLFKIFYQSIQDPNIYKTKPSILLYDIQNEFKLNINNKEIVVKPSTFRIEYSSIEKLGYYKNDSYIDLMHIFKVKPQTSIDIDD
jgi:hypothetical protein